MSWRDYYDKKKKISNEEKEEIENRDLNQTVATKQATTDGFGKMHIVRSSPYNYGRGNIDLNNRPVVQNDDGTISTVRSMSFYDENEGKEILVPTVLNGKIVSDSEARQHYYDTGEYLGKFDTVKEANSYAKRVHDQQERLYGQPKSMWDRVNEKAEWLSQQNAYDIYGNLFKGISNKADDLLYSDEVNEKYAKVQEEKRARQQARSESAKSKGLLAQVGAGATNLVENIFQKPKAFYDNDKLGVKDIFDIPKTAISTTINAGSHAIGAISDFGKSATNIFGAGMITASSAMGNEEDSQKWKNALREENESYQNFKEGLTSLGASDSALGKTGGQAVESITSSMAYGLDKVGGTLLLGSGLGSSLEESYSRDDVENWQAWTKGFGDMAIGYYAEKINDSFGFGGNGLSNTVKNAVMNKMKSGTAKFLTRLGLSGLFEASEEIIEPVAKNLIFNRALNFVTDLVGHGAKFDTNIDIEDMTSSSLLAFFQGIAGAKNQSTANINEKEIVKNMVDNLKEQGYEVTSKDKKLFKQIALTAKENAIAEDYKYASRDEAIQNSKLSDEQKSELLESVRKEDTKPKELKEKIKETEKANKEIEKKIETSNLPQAQKEGLTQLLHQNTNTAEMDSAVDYAIEEDRKVNARVNEQINAIDEGKTTVDKLINDNAKLTDAQKQDLLTRLNNGEIDDYTALTEVVDLEEDNQQKVDIINGMNYNINQKSNASIQNVTVAPYYDTPVTDENFEEIKNQVETDFINKANTITNLIGGKIKNVNTNIGGYEYQTGEKAGDVVNELSYTFELEDVDEEQANLFASLMGDLGYEKQETVIRSTYAEEGKGNSVETTINLNSIDGVKEILDKLGIKNYTIDTSNKQLKIYSDDLSNEIKILVADLAEELGGNFNGAEWNETDSEFLGEELRRGIYEAWLKNHKGEQEGELYKNISEAYRKLQGEQVNEEVVLKAENKEPTKSKQETTVNENSQNEGSFSLEENEFSDNEDMSDEKVAEILSKPYSKKEAKTRLRAIAMREIVDKGYIYENLDLQAKDTKNRTLQSKYHNMLHSYAQAQYTIAKGHNDYGDRGIYEIRADIPEADRQEFNEYAYHYLNIDRMSLESKAKQKLETLNKQLGEENNKLKESYDIDRAKQKELIKSLKREIKYLENVKNKPVFGDSITAEMSEKRVKELEQAHPEFKKYLDEVYKYLDGNVKYMVDHGVISQETAEYFKELYPHYVPIDRVDDLGRAINVPLDTNKTGINNPIHKATGGSSNIQPLFETIANRTKQTYMASNRNDLGNALYERLSELTTLESNEDLETELENLIDSEGTFGTVENVLDRQKDSLPTFTIFQNGKKVTFQINNDIYNSLREMPNLYKEINDSKGGEVLQTLSGWRRNIITEYNPFFMLTNAFKDGQDVLMNSQHPAQTYAKFPEAYAQIKNNGKWLQEYMANGGYSDTLFQNNEFKSLKTDEWFGKKALNAISNANNFIELAPRLAEYIASREAGASIETAMLDSARVTTNFSAGGDTAKLLNKNGFTFLNANIQGLAQQVRNVREANAKGLKGWTNLAIKSVIAGLPAILLNNLIWKDDDEYEDLADYVKDNYYVICKIPKELRGFFGGNNFFRIPKGRTVSAIQKIISNAGEYITNDKKISIDNILDDLIKDGAFAWESVGVADPRKK